MEKKYQSCRRIFDLDSAQQRVWVLILNQPGLRPSADTSVCGTLALAAERLWM